MSEVASTPVEATSKTIVIQGVEFSASLPYAEGHTLTASEARALNQVRLENLRNNFASKVKASIDKVEGAIPQNELPAKFAEFEAAYSFSMPGVGTSTRSLDPIEREALVLAKEMVKQLMATRGRSMTPPKEATDEQKIAFKASLQAKFEEVAQRPNVIAAARKNVKDREKSLAALGADLEL